MAGPGSDQCQAIDQLAEDFAARYRRGERPSLQEYLDKLRKKELETELAEGYIANASHARETAEAFSHVDLELL